jgi:hypothetical protein
MATPNEEQSQPTENDPRTAFDETLAADRIGGDESGATSDAKPGKEPVTPEDKQPVGNDPTTPGGGHGEGP